MWSFNDTSPLRVPRGIVVDSDGFVFVTGKETGNIVGVSILTMLIYEPMETAIVFVSILVIS
jgi:hypothetical protein